jgi:hypothetical protein
MQIRTSHEITAKEILRGKFVKAVKYGPYVEADEQGRLTVLRPSNPEHFAVSIEHPGFGPYWAGWMSTGQPQNIPEQFTAELEAKNPDSARLYTNGSKFTDRRSVSPAVEIR